MCEMQWVCYTILAFVLSTKILQLPEGEHRFTWFYQEFKKNMEGGVFCQAFECFYSIFKDMVLM